MNAATIAVTRRYACGGGRFNEAKREEHVEQDAGQFIEADKLGIATFRFNTFGDFIFDGSNFLERKYGDLNASTKAPNIAMPTKNLLKSIMLGRYQIM
jgi:hypothetical protein